MMLVAAITEETRQSFEFAGMPGGWLRLLSLTTIVFVCYAVVWLYRREARAGAAPRVRMLLALLRCVVLLLLAGVWLEPVVATYVKRTLRATVLVLADSSASMSIVDAAEDASAARVQKVKNLLESNQGRWLNALHEKNDVAAYVFGEQARRARLPWEREAPSSAPATAEAAPASQPMTTGLLEALSGREALTDLGKSISAAIADAGESPIAGIVLLSDGIVNQGLSIDDVAGYTRSFRAKVYAVGVGAEVEPPNVRVTNLAAPATVARGDPIELRVEVAVAGMDAAPLRVELTARPISATGDNAGEERVIGTRELTLGGEQATGDARFRVETESAGQFLYRARVAPIPGEAVEFDNVRAASVLVTDEKLRVLLVAGRPTFDYRAVTALLGRDKTIDLSCWLQSADPTAIRDGSTPIVELPRRPEELFAYDAIMLMDPDPREMDSSWAVNVRRLVDELGGGLLLQAGPLYTARFLRDERLADLSGMLPIAPDPDADVRLSERGSYYTLATPLRIPDEARGHPMLQLHADSNVNRSVWEALPGAWWMLPVLREKPLAAVLLRGAASAASAAGAAPIVLAAQPFGAGRVVFLGMDGTWRWRATAERYFDRFWIQVVRYLSQARRQGVSRRGAIALDREAYDVGQTARIEARVLDAAFAPIGESDVGAEVELSDGRRVEARLSAIPGREGWFSGRVPLDVDGPAVVRVPLPGGAVGGAAEALLKNVQINRPDIEMRTLRMNREALTRLADQTGGRFVPIAEAADLPQWIENASQTRTIPGPRHALWDRAWLLLLIAALLGIEWFVRRRNHLL